MVSETSTICLSLNVRLGVWSSFASSLYLAVSLIPTKLERNALKWEDVEHGTTSRT